MIFWTRRVVQGVVQARKQISGEVRILFHDGCDFLYISTCRHGWPGFLHVVQVVTDDNSMRAGNGP